MSKRYFIEIAYQGQNYCGWQVQPNGVTVQSTLTDALSTITQQPIHTIGCGRTDSGVHASQFFVHFDLEGEVPENFLYRINKFLPKDISVFRLIPNVPPDANTRFDATYRAYDYYVHFNKSPFLHQQSFFYPWTPLNLNEMNKAAALLLNYKDFRMFCKSGHSSKTTLCNLYKSEFIYDEAAGKLRFHIAANRFLRGMVRRVMGALLMVGKGKISLAEFKDAMDNKKEQFDSMNVSMPPQGLYLSEVRYPYLDDTDGNRRRDLF